MPEGDIKVHCCGVEEKGHCFALEYRDEVVFLDAGFNLDKNYYNFLDLKVDKPYNEVAEIVGAPILSNINLENVKGFCLSHEHSDHVSGLPFLYTEVCNHTWKNPPIFSTKATIRGAQHKFDVHEVPFYEEIFISVEDKDSIPEKYKVSRFSQKFHSLFKVKIGQYFTIMWVPVEHSTQNAYSLGVVLPKNRLVLYSGDYKLNLKSNRPPQNILKALNEEYSKRLLICETIGVDQEGITGTEELMEEKLDQSLTGLNPRLILVAIRASQVPRIHTFESLAIKMSRQIALIGTSMMETYDAMRVNFPGVLVGDYKKFEPRELKNIDSNEYNKYIFLADARMWHTYNSTFHNILKGGAPLEPDATHKYACKGEKMLTLSKNDVVILSTTSPFNTYMKKCLGHVKRHIRASGAKFYPDIHISGHGCIGDYRVFIETLNPEVLIPFHREQKARETLAERTYYNGEFHNPKDGDIYIWRDGR